MQWLMMEYLLLFVKMQENSPMKKTPLLRPRAKKLKTKPICQDPARILPRGREGICKLWFWIVAHIFKKILHQKAAKMIGIKLLWKRSNSMTLSAWLKSVLIKISSRFTKLIRLFKLSVQLTTSTKFNLCLQPRRTTTSKTTWTTSLWTQVVTKSSK